MRIAKERPSCAIPVRPRDRSWMVCVWPPLPRRRRLVVLGNGHCQCSGGRQQRQCNSRGSGYGPREDAGGGAQYRCRTPDTGRAHRDKKEMCNVPGTQDASLVTGRGNDAQRGDGLRADDLWDNKGAFAGGTVEIGTYQDHRKRSRPTRTCGVCVRGLGRQAAAPGRRILLRPAAP